ncbi:hypothetical protein FB451DRAFT_293661 [Mycena latifolia]|nr:hypothetical protein FB451DRAFT_293661 [Mycena latifolia]
MHIPLTLLAAFSWMVHSVEAQNPVVPTLDNSPITFVNSKWIWTSEMATGSAPVDALRSFRKAFVAPEGKTPVLAHILCVSDDDHTFFVNGRVVSSGPFAVPRSVCVGLNPCLNVFAVKVQNSGGGPAGLLVAIRVTYSDGTTSTLVTDASWRVDMEVKPGFEGLAFDDSSWNTAYVFANNDQGPSKITAGGTATLDPESIKCEDVKKTACKCGTVCSGPSMAVKSELECSADAGNVEYLSAVPGEGCVCKSTPGPYYCGVPAGDDNAVQMCSDKVDSAGNRDVKCYVKCSAGFIAQDQNTCVKPAPQLPDRPTGCACCEGEAAKREVKEAEERKARQEERQERAEARQARAEERQEREEARQARTEERKARESCPCPNPRPPTVKDAPAVADEAMQALIKKKMNELGIDNLGCSDHRTFMFSCIALANGISQRGIT